MARICSSAGVGQQVAGKLPGDELIERHVGVEGPHDPVTPRPRLALAIDLKAVAVGVAGRVQPIDGHALAVMLGGEQAVDQSLVGIGRIVGRQRLSISAGVGGRPVRSKLTGESACDGRLPAAAAAPTLGQAIGDQRHRSAIASPVPGTSTGRSGMKAPMVFIFCALLDPQTEGLYFGVREPLELRRRGRHALVFVGARYASQEQQLSCGLCGAIAPAATATSRTSSRRSASRFFASGP